MSVTLQVAMTRAFTGDKVVFHELPEHGEFVAVRDEDMFKWRMEFESEIVRRHNECLRKELGLPESWCDMDEDGWCRIAEEEVRLHKEDFERHQVWMRHELEWILPEIERCTDDVDRGRLEAERRKLVRGLAMQWSSVEAMLRAPAVAELSADAQAAYFEFAKMKRQKVSAKKKGGGKIMLNGFKMRREHSSARVEARIGTGETCGYLKEHLMECLQESEEVAGSLAKKLQKLKIHSNEIPEHVRSAEAVDTWLIERSEDRALGRRRSRSPRGAPMVPVAKRKASRTLKKSKDGVTRKKDGASARCWMLRSSVCSSPHSFITCMRAPNSGV